LTHCIPGAVAQPPVPGSMFGYPSIHFQQIEEGKLEGKYVSLHLFQVHPHVLRWLIQAVHPEYSSYGACSCCLPLLGSSGPTTDTPCFEQAAVGTETMARQQLPVLYHSRVAWVLVEVPLEAHHGSRQKQGHLARSRSGFFSLAQFLHSCQVDEPPACCPFSSTRPARLCCKAFQNSNGPLPCTFPNTVS